MRVGFRKKGEIYLDVNKEKSPIDFVMYRAPDSDVIHCVMIHRLTNGSYEISSSKPALETKNLKCSFDEAVNFAATWIESKNFDLAMESALARLSSSIAQNVSTISHTLDLSIARMRGNMFARDVRLKSQHRFICALNKVGAAKAALKLYPDLINKIDNYYLTIDGKEV